MRPRSDATVGVFGRRSGCRQAYDWLSAKPSTASKLDTASKSLVSRDGDVDFFGAGGGQAGVITVLDKEASWHRKIPREATTSVSLKTRIASHDAGIAQIINDLSNPLRSDSGSSALTGVRVQIPASAPTLFLH